MSIKMTERLYDEDSHLKSFTALVLDCTKDGEFFKVVLDKTAFFPEGGGQGSDKGFLNDIPVTDVQIENNIIYHKISKPIEIGKTIKGEIDWPTRFRRMQNHSGEHIVSGIVHSKFHLNNIGFHLGEDDTTCDYDGTLTKDDILSLEVDANTAVFQNINIISKYPSKTELQKMEYRSKKELNDNIRIVTIPGIDTCACCAPHVNTTGEIGIIKITWFEKSHGGTRLHLSCGYDALVDYNIKQSNILRIMDLLSARQYETASSVEKLISTSSDLKHKLSVSASKIAKMKLESMKNAEGNLVVLLEDSDTDTLRTLANGGKEKCTGVFVALTNSENGYRYMITSKSLPLRKLAPEFNAYLVGRGGGKDDMIQGNFSASLETINAFFEGYTYKE